MRTKKLLILFVFWLLLVGCHDTNSFTLTSCDFKTYEERTCRIYNVKKVYEFENNQDIYWSIYYTDPATKTNINNIYEAKGF